MARLQRALVALAVFVALLSLFIVILPDLMFPRAGAKTAPLKRGRNKAVLFISLSEPGQINMQLSAAQVLLDKHPSIGVHFASFAAAERHVRRVNSTIPFHAFPGMPRMHKVQQRLPGCSMGSLTCFSHPPGKGGIDSIAGQMELIIWPWAGDEHLALHDSIIGIMDQVDPSVVIVDWQFRPSVDAVRTAGRQYILMSPLAAADVLAPVQPYLAQLWKYPTWGTGFSYPVPWLNRLDNAYIALRTVYGLLFHPTTKDAITFLSARGIDAADISGIPSDVYFITQTPPQFSIPVTARHPHVLDVGPMLIHTGVSAEQQDAELARWVGRAPTVVVNLGSLYEYDDNRARTMASALAVVLREFDNVQILWKYAQKDLLSPSILSTLEHFISAERLKISKWLPIDTLPLLSIPSVIVSVNQGGASSVYEAIT